MMATERANSLVDVSESVTAAKLDSRPDKRRATKDDSQVGERIVALKRTRSGHIAYLTRQYKAIESALISYESHETVYKYAADIANQ